MGKVKTPRRLWIIKAYGTASYQVCKDEEELSVPYMSVQEHEQELEEWKMHAEMFCCMYDNAASDCAVMRDQVNKLRTALEYIVSVQKTCEGYKPGNCTDPVCVALEALK